MSSLPPISLPPSSLSEPLPTPVLVSMYPTELLYTYLFTMLMDYFTQRKESLPLMPLPRFNKYQHFGSIASDHFLNSFLKGGELVRMFDILSG